MAQQNKPTKYAADVKQQPVFDSKLTGTARGVDSPPEPQLATPKGKPPGATAWGPPAGAAETGSPSKATVPSEAPLRSALVTVR